MDPNFIEISQLVEDNTAAVNWARAHGLFASVNNSLVLSMPNRTPEEVVLWHLSIYQHSPLQKELFRGSTVFGGCPVYEVFVWFAK